mmetsp:Transcript_15602/g.36964  ORF Transcript_15602/g.36964 Transcript_15602/m.36964 type:complete len:246 (-) Transcript_15602:820-1557(-)
MMPRLISSTARKRLPGFSVASGSALSSSSKDATFKQCGLILELIASECKGDSPSPPFTRFTSALSSISLTKTSGGAHLSAAKVRGDTIVGAVILFTSALYSTNISTAAPLSHTPINGWPRLLVWLGSARISSRARSISGLREHCMAARWIGLQSGNTSTSAMWGKTLTAAFRSASFRTSGRSPDSTAQHMAPIPFFWPNAASRESKRKWDRNSSIVLVGCGKPAKYSYLAAKYLYRFISFSFARR